MKPGGGIHIGLNLTSRFITSCEGLYLCGVCSYASNGGSILCMPLYQSSAVPTPVAGQLSFAAQFEHISVHLADTVCMDSAH